MLLVDTYLSQSGIHGIGLFAGKPIPRGERIWEFKPGFDQELSQEQVDVLSEPCRERILSYAYFNARKAQYILCADDARFMNHNDHPNTQSVGFVDGKEGFTIAARDISQGEEITEDYRLYEEATRNVQYGIADSRVTHVGQEIL